MKAVRKMVINFAIAVHYPLSATNTVNGAFNGFNKQRIYFSF